MALQGWGARRRQLILGSYRSSMRSYTVRIYEFIYARKVSRYQYGKLDYGDQKGAKRMCAGEGSSCVRSLISKADDLWRASLRCAGPLDRSLSRSYDKGWASTHPHAKGPLGSWHDGAESSVWFECECLKHNGNVIPFLAGELRRPRPYWILSLLLVEPLPRNVGTSL